jgi:hypothetical protein
VRTTSSWTRALALLILASCTRSPESHPQALSTSSATATSGTATPEGPGDLVGFPLARLKVATNPVVALDLPIAPAALEANGVKTYRSFTATAPRVFLLVFETSDHAAASALAGKIDALISNDRAPYYRKPVTTGSWLLVTGFPSDKPVSPEMEAARTVFVSRWAGEE